MTLRINDIAPDFEAETTLVLTSPGDVDEYKNNVYKSISGGSYEYVGGFSTFALWQADSRSTNEALETVPPSAIVAPDFLPDVEKNNGKSRVLTHG